MNNSFKYFALSMLLLAMMGCTAEDITQIGGTLPDETPMNSVGGILRSERTLSNLIDIDLYEEDEESNEYISYTLTKPATSTVTLKAIANEALADAYNEKYNLETKTFPTANMRFENDGTLTIAAGKQTSAAIKATISTDGLEIGTLYLLALTIEKAATNVEAQAEKQALYYRIYIEKKATTIEPNPGIPEDIPELLPNLTSVFYVNTETYQPYIANAFGITAQPKGQSRKIYSLGNIINLKRATINYDALSQRVMFTLGTDLGYVLEHSNKYLRPIQVHNRKICICIENGGQGIGFCNMNATQITDFVRQVKAVVERYDLDGINLWDEDSKYGKTGIPEMNTTSYPMLIKKLSEALPGKLLTLVDKGDATEYFYDVDKCGGIKVGSYIDYAWHGYVSPTEILQVINPNLEGSPQDYSKYTRKSIAGLNASCYGSVNVPCYNDNDKEIRDPASEIITKWKTIGNKKSNILVYGNDLIGQEYAGYETATENMISGYSISRFMDDGYTWNFDSDTQKAGTTRYTAGRLYATASSGPDANPFRKDW
ncbi:BT_3987 domain-containing protein [uncultured Bacteroides sp.]|uniref:BT_3987 domain-containing protein n=1 Tax=uncultured Bacteroides sp. TaxID=162156 RepID=UPI00280A784A|nr:DUF1735 domain-containing protein [uncultured Bacteroides sp.]